MDIQFLVRVLCSIFRVQGKITASKLLRVLQVLKHVYPQELVNTSQEELLRFLTQLAAQGLVAIRFRKSIPYIEPTENLVDECIIEDPELDNIVHTLLKLSRTELAVLAHFCSL